MWPREVRTAVPPEPVTVPWVKTGSGDRPAGRAGNKGETKILIPMIDQFKPRHQLAGLVVVADAGMLSAANLNALEDAGFGFIVGSRISKAPYDLPEHFEKHAR